MGGEVLMVQRGPGWEMGRGQMGERTRRGTVPVRSPLVAGGRNPTRTGKKGLLWALMPGKDTSRSESNKVVRAVTLPALPLFVGLVVFHYRQLFSTQLNTHRDTDIQKQKH